VFFKMAGKFDAGLEIEEQITKELNRAFTEAEQL